MAKEKLIQLQFALFFDTIENRPDKFMDKIDDALEGIFDKMPTILPIPEGAPPEIPNVIMQSSNGIYQCNIAKNRIDFTANYISSHTSPTVNIEDFISKLRPFASIVFGLKSITRFGLVAQYFFKQTSPMDKIQNKYFKTHLGELEELSIRYNKRFEFKNLVFNDLIEISGGHLSEPNKGPQAGILVQRDINNVPVSSLNIEDAISVILDKQDSFKLSGIMRLVP